MTTITNNLTATRKCNASVVNEMFENAFFAYRRAEVSNSLQADAQFEAIAECIAMLVKESKQAVRNAVINAYEESVAEQKVEDEDEEQVETTAGEPMTKKQTGTTRLQNFDNGKWVTCENTGKHIFGKVVWRSIKTGRYYERLSPNGRKCGLPYYFRSLDTDWVEANWK